jgi:uncharacterized membrane protein YhaH (DUF805 family)
MTFGQAITTCFRKYADFTGRATRPEYWWFVLFTFIVSTALGIVGSTISFGAFRMPMMGGYGYNYGSGYGTNILSSLWSLAVLLPGLAVAVRRLRDSGRGWGNLFWVLLPIAGLIILIVQLCQPSIPEAPASVPPPPPPAAPAA